MIFLLKSWDILQDLEYKRNKELGDWTIIFDMAYKTKESNGLEIQLYLLKLQNKEAFQLMNACEYELTFGLRAS